MLRIARGVCVRGRMVGSIVVRVMLDYRTLPFISSQSPYLESLRPNRQVAPEGVSGRDVEFIVYGWSRAPIFESGTRVWTLPDPVFQRLVESREPFWAHARSRRPDVPRLFPERPRRHLRARLSGDQLVRPSDQPRRAGDAGGGALRRAAGRPRRCSARSACERPASGRALLREVRSSFYRKLFLAFWAGAVVPVFILAIFIRTYVATQLLDGAAEAAARTVTTAQRLVEDYAALQQRGADRARRDRRSDHGAGPPRDRRGRQPVRSHAPAGDERARSVRVAAAVAAHARRRLPRHPARSAADLRRPGAGRRSSLPAGGARRCARAAAKASSPCR